MEKSIRALWKQVFRDTDEYIDLFFMKRYNPANAMVVHDDNKVVSMLFALPIDLVLQDKIVSARYVYAVGTSPQFRQRGLSSLLLEAMHERLTEKGVQASILVPASEDLFAFYERRGYQTIFHIKIKTETFHDNSEKLLLKKSTLCEQYELRDNFFSSSRLYARWGREALAYQDAEISLLKGDVLAFDDPYRGYAVCVPTDMGVSVKELITGPQEDVILKAIAAHYQVKNLVVRRWGGENDKPFGMIKWYSQKRRKFTNAKPPYLGLVLD
jgi:GNAT superfamily N-acetyltransferase